MGSEKCISVSSRWVAPRRFSNSKPLPLGGCTERISAENEGSETKKSGLSGTERHRDQGRDQDRDHETKTSLGLVHSARELLVAVADGDGRSVALAGDLVRVILDDPMVRRALVLEELLRTRSPFALVRAVELAEQLISNSQSSPALHTKAERRRS